MRAAAAPATAAVPGFTDGAAAAGFGRHVGGRLRPGLPLFAEVTDRAPRRTHLAEA